MQEPVYYALGQFITIIVISIIGLGLLLRGFFSKDESDQFGYYMFGIMILLGNFANACNFYMFALFNALKSLGYIH